MRVLMGMMIVVLSVTACSKKDDADKQMPPVSSSPAASGAVQQQPVKNAAAPIQQVQTNTAPVVPVPVTPRKGDIVAKQQFSCKNGTNFVANFMRNPDQVEIIFTGRMPVILPQQVMASGFSYASPQYKLLGKGRAARWIMTGKEPVDCVAK